MKASESKNKDCVEDVPPQILFAQELADQDAYDAVLTVSTRYDKI